MGKISFIYKRLRKDKELEDWRKVRQRDVGI